jgi:hypothetical protein
MLSTSGGDSSSVGVCLSQPDQIRSAFCLSCRVPGVYLASANLGEGATLPNRKINNLRGFNRAFSPIPTVSTTQSSETRMLKPSSTKAGFAAISRAR